MQPMSPGQVFALIVNGLQYAAVERLERAIESIQSTIEDQGGNLVVKMKVIQLSTSFDLSADSIFSRKRSRRQKSKIWHSSWLRLGRRTLRCRVMRTKKIRLLDYILLHI